MEALALGFNLRNITRDLDAIILKPEEGQPGRQIIDNAIRQVASEFDLRPDWLNEQVRVYVTAISEGPIVFKSAGIVVRRASIEQLLAMKLAASRDAVDDSDAQALLQMLIQNTSFHDEATIWQAIQSFVPYKSGAIEQAKSLLHIFWLRLKRDNDP